MGHVETTPRPGTAASSVAPASGPRLVSVVVPLLNEEATLAALHAEVMAALDAAGLAWEIVFVDDGSTDGSYAELVRLHGAFPNVRVVRLRRNLGKAVALAVGFDVAAGDVGQLVGEHGFELVGWPLSPRSRQDDCRAQAAQADRRRHLVLVG